MRYFSSLMLSLVMTACATAGQAATSLVGNSEAIPIHIVVAQATTSELRDTPISRPTKPKQRQPPTNTTHQAVVTHLIRSCTHNLRNSNRRRHDCYTIVMTTEPRVEREVTLRLCPSLMQ